MTTKLFAWNNNWNLHNVTNLPYITAVLVVSLSLNFILLEMSRLYSDSPNVVYEQSDTY